MPTRGLLVALWLSLALEGQAFLLQHPVGGFRGRPRLVEGCTSRSAVVGVTRPLASSAQLQLGVLRAVSRRASRDGWNGPAKRGARGLGMTQSEPMGSGSVPARSGGEGIGQDSKLYTSEGMRAFAIFGLAAVINRVLYRVQLVPLRGFTYVISLLTSISYVIVYSIILVERTKRGEAKPSHYNYVWNNIPAFMVVGVCEAVGFALGLLAASNLPGGLISVFAQSSLPWTILLSSALLGRRFTALQVTGAAITMLGSLVCAFPQLNVAGCSPSSLLGAAGTYVASVGCFCVASVLKDRAFRSEELDVFIVNTFGSFSQFMMTILLLPITFAVATTMTPAEYFGRAWAALSGAGSAPGAELMPMLTVMYIIANLVLNISAIRLLKLGGAVEINLASMALVPINSLLFCLPIPLLVATPFTLHFVGGLAIVVCGGFLYNHKILLKFNHKILSFEEGKQVVQAGDGLGSGRLGSSGGPRIVPGAGIVGGLMPGYADAAEASDIIADRGV